MSKTCHLPDSPQFHPPLLTRVHLKTAGIKDSLSIVKVFSRGVSTGQTPQLRRRGVILTRGPWTLQ